MSCLLKHQPVGLFLCLLYVTMPLSKDTGLLARQERTKINREVGTAPLVATVNLSDKTVVVKPPSDKRTIPHTLSSFSKPTISWMLHT